VDYHAMTISCNPAQVQEQIFDAACANLACGLGPSHCILFVQTNVL
jgi:tryptophanyl-tRNA synthetase